MFEFHESNIKTTIEELINEMQILERFSNKIQEEKEILNYQEYINSKKEIKKCPECNSIKFINDHNHGEIVCGICGLVIDDKLMDMGSEWRPFNNELLLEKRLDSLEKKKKSLKKILFEKIYAQIYDIFNNANKSNINIVDYIRMYSIYSDKSIRFFKSIINDLYLLFKDESPLNMKEFFKIAQSKDYIINNEIIFIFDSIFTGYNLKLIPSNVLNFISSYLKDKKLENILDPWADSSSFLISLANDFNNSNKTGIIINKEIKEFLLEQNHNLEIKWILQGNKSYESPILNKLKAEKQTFDLVIGIPPLIKQNDRYVDSSKSITLTDEYNKIQLLKASVLLNDNGIGLFLIENDFLYERSGKTVWQNLYKFGLYVEALINLPETSLNEKITEPVLLLIRKKKFKEIFIGDLSSNEDINRLLLENLKKRKKGKTPQKGVFINNIETFISFNKFYSEIEFRKKALKTGLRTVPVSKITSEINHLSKENTISYESTELNSIFLPIKYSIPVSNEINSQLSYIQLILKLDKVNSDYLAHFYNSELGKKVRYNLGFEETRKKVKNLKTLNKIQKLNEFILMNSEVYIPDINTQNQVLTLDHSINDIITQLNIDKRNLWKYPRRTRKIQKNIELLNRGFSLEDWMATLPFPLSSILWSYEREVNRNLKFKYLLRFFEAYSEFNLAFMLSAITQDMNFYRDHFDKCLRNAFKNWYLEPDFGNWTYIGMCIAKKLRIILEGPHKQHCLNLFGNPNSDLLSVIISNDLYHILQEARKKRNHWDAHDTPTIPTDECDRRIEILLDLLSNLRTLTSNLYDSILFFIAITGGCTRESCSYEVKELKGPMTSFKKNIIETSENVLLSEIYFINEDQLNPINMLPFIKIKESPHQEQDACYFYNRIQEGEARLVTYHFKKKFEDFIPEKEFELINILKSL